MTYQLGIDLGTTYTSAAIADGGRVEALNLGTRSAVLPTVVFARDDGELLVGETAETRGIREPTRVAREFKRRLGDTAPLVLGGVPYPAEALMAAVLAHVRAAAVQRMGAEPSRVVVTHPATYSNYRLDLLRDAVRRAGLTSVEFLTEPQAAATHYASLDRVAIGDAIAVYDLGGGTFDAAIVRNTPEGFELLGQPQGLERLGGIDFDVAVLEHVNNSLGGQLDGLSDDDPAVRAGLARLRTDARHAKETLSGDTDTTISLIVPGIVGEVALSRTELERLVMPRIRESIAVLRQALTSAHLEPADLASVLLVGGSSRIPAVRQMVSEALRVRVTADVDPEMAVALGAARHAAGLQATPGPAPLAPPPATQTPPAPTPSAPPTGTPSAPPTGTPSPNRRVLVFAAAAAMVIALVAFVATRGGGDSASTDDQTSQPPGTETGTAPSTANTVQLGFSCEQFIALVADPDSTAESLLFNGAAGCDLRNLQAQGRDFTGVDFTGADLTGANLTDANLSAAQLEDADLSDANFTNANLEGAKLLKAKAPGAVFDSAVLRGASFVEVDCTRCSFSGTELVGSDMAQSDLGGADLAFADMASVGIADIFIDSKTKLGPAPGPVLLVSAGASTDVVDKVGDLAAEVGYVNFAEGTLPLQSFTAVSCRGDFAGSETRKLLLLVDHYFLGDVQEVDFNQIDGDFTISDEATACVVIVGGDLILAG